MPGRYYEAHALYFWPSVALLALALFFIFHAMQRIVQPAVPMDAQKAARH
jgi:Na+/proline symporter